MTTVDRLRPQPQDLDAEWSEATLGMILATPHGRQRRKRRAAPVVATSLVAGLTLGGGVVYAGGFAPPWAVTGFDRLAPLLSAPFDPGQLRSVADFTVPDGTRIQVWQGRDERGRTCEALDITSDGEPAAGHRGPSIGCFASRQLVQTSSVGTDSAGLPEYFYVYGTSPRPGAVSVHITGRGMRGEGMPETPSDTIDVSFPVDPSTGGFGGYLAGAEPAAWQDLTLRFLDEGGTEIARLRPWR